MMNWELIVSFLASLVAPVFVGVVKNVLGLRGLAALWTLYMFCLGLSFAIIFAFNKNIDLQNVAQVWMIAVATAQTVYTIVSKQLNSENKEKK